MYSDTLYLFFVKVATVFKMRRSCFIWIMKHIVKILVLTNFLLRSSTETHNVTSNGRNLKTLYGDDVQWQNFMEISTRKLVSIKSGHGNLGNIKMLKVKHFGKTLIVV